MKTVILCGGSGTRLWPISRKKSPKQFVRLFKDESLFQKTIKRNESFCDSYIVIVNQDQLTLSESQVDWQNHKKVEFFVEPIGRNTAPAIALAAFSCKSDDVLLVLPSDHLIENIAEYEKCVKEAHILALQNMLVTFGMTAKYPETGYGYIEAEGNRVKSFKEKPDLETAKQYLASGNYFWNSGMFCFKAGVFLEELKKYSPEIYHQAFLTFKQRQVEENQITFSLTEMEKIPAISIDYAVMEKSNRVAVVPSSFHWSDVGSYDSLAQELATDESGNTLGENIVALNSKNNLIIGNKKVMATFDVEDLIIVETEEALIVGKKGQSQKVKDLLEIIKNKYPELE